MSVTSARTTPSPEYTVNDASGEVTTERALSADEYEGWVDWINPVAGEQMGTRVSPVRPEGFAVVRGNDDQRPPRVCRSPPQGCQWGPSLRRTGSIARRSRRIFVVARFRHPRRASIRGNEPRRSASIVKDCRFVRLVGGWGRVGSSSGRRWWLRARKSGRVRHKNHHHAPASALKSWTASPLCTTPKPALTSTNARNGSGPGVECRDQNQGG